MLPRQNLTKEKVVDAAIELMESKMSTKLEMKELAEYLSIKPASLYHHVDSLTALYHALGEKAYEALTQGMQSAIYGKIKSEAIMALAECNREFAKNSPVLYRIYLQLPTLAPEVLTDHSTSEDIYQSLFRDYALSEAEKLQLSRTLRSLIHGFISLETGGYFQNSIVPKEDSFDYMLTQFLHLLGDVTERRAT